MLNFVKVYNQDGLEDYPAYPDSYVMATPNSLVEGILESFGEDIKREGLKDTPKRYIKFLNEFLNKPCPELTTFLNDAGTEDMIIVKDIPFYSLCEHHMIPFFGIANIAYIPFDRIIGISKIPRIVDYYASKLQNQERITSQISEILLEGIEGCKGVAVKLSARHMCMEMRGIKAHGATTDTFAYRGIFVSDIDKREQFLKSIK